MTLSTGSILIDRYRIVRLLGQGGFGAVYRSWDLTLERPCAIKESLDTTQEAQRQFKREAKLLANLAHPNLPRVTDYFSLPEQGQYLVMDFVEGEDLQELLNRAAGPLPEARIQPWMIQVCDALTYLHAQKPPIIHRDIKPANIKITPEGKAMLVDFGIAKAYDPKSQTTAGARAVTPGFSPYEQYGMGSTDIRSDVYALGATLYALLTGKAPPESLQRVLRDQMEPAEQLNSHISQNVRVALHQALQTDPSNRFQTVSEFKLALQGRQSMEGLEIQPAQFRARGRSNLQSAPSRPKSRAMTPVISLLLLAGLVISVLIVVVLMFSSSGSIAGLINRSLASLAGAISSPTTQPLAQTGTPVSVQVPSVESTGVTAPLSTVSGPHEGGDTTVSNMDGATLVYIPAGEFWMGSTDEEAGPRVDQQPRHRVFLNAYWIDRLEVSNGRYKMCVEAGACQPPVKSDSATRKNYYGNPDFVDFPVIWISHRDATSYCTWANRRLPSEAEWERAARGDTGLNLYPWGSREPDGELANFCDVNCSFDWKSPSIDDTFADTAPVNQFAAGASPFGLLNMAGNVWEWVFDYYLADYYSSSPSENPFGPPSGVERVLRGGSYENAAMDIRSTNRFYFGGDAATSSFGFRCADDAE